LPGLRLNEILARNVSTLVTNGASVVCLGQASGSAHDANARGVAIQASLT